MNTLCIILSIIGIITILCLANHYLGVFHTWRFEVRRAIIERHSHTYSDSEEHHRLARLELVVNDIYKKEK